MADVTELLDRLHEALRKTGAFDDTVYTDVPILKKGSDIPRPKPRVEPTPELTEMREIAYRSDAQFEPIEKVFYRQAKLMENYEDEYESTEPVRNYIMSYSDLTNEQLRNYFTWRKYARKGEIRPVCTAFAVLYASELINNIGAADPADAHEQLVRLRDNWSGSETPGNINDWIRDHVIYYGLPAELLDSDPEIQGDKAMETLLNCRERPDDELLAALSALSSYKPERSTFYKERPEEFTAALCGIYRGLDAYYEEQGAERLFERLFGQRTECVYYMFRAAMFCKKAGQPDREYIVNGVRRYKFRLGLWFLDTYYTSRSASKKLGELMRSADCVMREKLGAKHKLTGSTATRTETAVMLRALDLYLEDKKRAETEKIEIDVTKLGGIRKAADITRDKLIVDDEPAMAPAAPAPSPAPEPEPDPSPIGEQPSELPLTAEELAYLRHLLYGSAAPVGIMPTLLADSINEKLFDMFGDTVLNMNGGDPQVIEDYEEELKGTITE